MSTTAGSGTIPLFTQLQDGTIVMSGPLTVEGQITSIYQFPASVPNWTTRAHNLAVTGGPSGGTTASSVPQSDFTSAVTTFAGDVVTDQVLALKGKKTSNDGSNWVVDQFVLSVG